MSRKYRIKEEINYKGKSLFFIEKTTGFFFWSKCSLSEYITIKNEPIQFLCLNDAQDYIKRKTVKEIKYHYE